MNRRKFVMGTGAVLLSPALLQLRGVAESKRGSEFASFYSDEMSDMLVTYLVKKQNDLASAWDRKRALLKTAADVEARNAFVREKVVQHAELHLLLSMITPLGWLEQVPTYKEQQQQIGNLEAGGKDLSTYGFLGYPLLQSADILIY